jgi:hypothetical protein
MKHFLTILALVAISAAARAQENMVSLSYGFEWANLDFTDEQGSGWRINGVYEFNPGGSKFVQGIAFGYANVSADYTFTEGNNSEERNAKISTWPIYYAPKVLFGSGKVKPFIKGAIGMQFSKLETTSALRTVTANGAGFYGGGGGGLLLFVKDNIFLNAEYEIAWLSNSYYEGGWLQSGLIGVGIKF